MADLKFHKNNGGRIPQYILFIEINFTYSLKENIFLF